MDAIRLAWRRLFLTALFVALAVTPFTVGPHLLALTGGEGRLGAYGQDDEPAVRAKLTTVLADLAGAVPQQDRPALRDRSGIAPRLNIDALPRSVRDAARTRRLRLDARNTAQVYVLMQEVNAENVQALAAAGAEIEIADAPSRRVQARIPVRMLYAVAALPFVNFIRLPTYARFRTGSVNTEGDAILHSSSARSQFGVDGTGVKVGVLSDGIRGVFATGCQTCSGAANGPIANGDLPNATGTRQSTGIGTFGALTSVTGGITAQSFVTGADTTTGPQKGDLEGTLTNCSFRGAGAEGTALLEIVHDIAPNAQLSFANFDTDLSFNQAVNWLAATNDVVIDDIGFYGLPADGTSSVSQNTAAALNNPSNRIRAYVTAVGNAADEHYIGTYLASAVAASTMGISAAGHIHQFQQSSDTTDILGRGAQPYNLISLPVGGEVVIFLTWNDSFGASGNNYDLYLVQENGGVVASSTDVQSGAQDPMEALDYVNNTGSAGFFRIVVQNVGDRAVAKDLNLFSFQPECAAAGPKLLATGHHERHNYNTATRSVSAQNDAGGSPVSVISVGAICSASSAAQSVFSGSATPDESCFDATNSTPEFFSSRGPTLDGRTKPDIAGIDGVSVTGSASFPNPFFGTSAAAPHVAGIAALALQAAPCLVSGASGALDPASARARLRSLLTGNAAGLGDPNTFGSGRADAQATMQATVPALSGSSVSVPGTSSAGATITAAQLGFSDPNQCPLGNMKWTGGCGTSPGSSMTCPLGTTNVSVQATNNGVAFSSPVSVQVNVTSFALSAAPTTSTISAGQSATYQVTVSSQTGPFPANVALACANLPPNATCSFSPATVTPGATSAQSTLTISTKAPTLAGVMASASSDRKACNLRGDHTAPIGLLLVLVFAVAMRSSFDRLRTNGHGSVRAELVEARTAAIAWTLSASALRRLAAMAAGASAVAILAMQLACGSTPSPPPPPSPAPAVTLSPTGLSFGTQFVSGTSAPQTITLTNSGNATLTISAISASGDFAQTNTCGTSLAAGSSCSISVTFAPTATGQRTGAVSITDNAANSPHTATLSGTGQAANGTPAGTYQVSVTGTSGALVQSGSFTLVVR